MREGLVRALVEGAVDRVVAGERADRVLDRVLRAHRELDPEERRRVARWTLGLSLWRGRIDALARGDRNLWFGLFLADRQGFSPEEAAALAGCGAASLRAALAAPPTPTDPVERLALERSLPVWLARRWSERLGADGADRLAGAMNEPGPVAVRANRLKNDRETLRAALAQEGVRARPGALAPDALLLEGRPNIFGLRAWREGRFEVQDEGSQWLAEAVRAAPGETVVDLCAGSGGKTLALAAAMGDRGRLVAVDADEARLRDLAVRAKRAGVVSVQVRHGDGREPALLADLAGQADAVLVDAPCSETGALRRGPDARWRLDPGAPARFAPLQAALLQAAAGLVRPGGRLVYATCSLEPEEDEAVADAFSAARAEFVPGGHARVGPDREGCDGFFRAVWTRAG